MSKARTPHPQVQAIEQSLASGAFIAYGRSWDFVRSLDEVKDELDAAFAPFKAGAPQCIRDYPWAVRKPKPLESFAERSRRRWKQQTAEREH